MMTDPREERVEIQTEFPALFEYSMKKNMTVDMAQFDVPRRTSSIMTISIGVFRELASKCVESFQTPYSAAH